MKMVKIILTSLIVITLSSYAHAYDYDPLLMRAQASIFPKIILLDKELDRKVASGQVVITILHSSEEEGVALQIKGLIEDQYKNNLGKQTLFVNIADFEQFDESHVATAYFLLKGTEVLRNKVTAYAAKQKRLAFSYDYKDFESNALVSVLVKEKTYIYLNKAAIHDYDIKFLPLFYKIVKVIE